MSNTKEVTERESLHTKTPELQAQADEKQFKTADKPWKMPKNTLQLVNVGQSKILSSNAVKIKRS